jgi:hypothetical protein
MAAPITKRQAETSRKAIQTTKLIKKLQDHVLNNSEMKDSQIRAGLGLLKKSLPDLSNLELAGDGGGPLVVEVVRFADKTSK